MSGGVTSARRPAALMDETTTTNPKAKLVAATKTAPGAGRTYPSGRFLHGDDPGSRHAEADAFGVVGVAADGAERLHPVDRPTFGARHLPPGVAGRERPVGAEGLEECSLHGEVPARGEVVCQYLVRRCTDVPVIEVVEPGVRYSSVCGQLVQLRGGKEDGAHLEPVGAAVPVGGARQCLSHLLP